MREGILTTIAGNPREQGKGGNKRQASARDYGRWRDKLLNLFKRDHRQHRRAVVDWPGQRIILPEEEAKRTHRRDGLFQAVPLFNAQL